MPKGIASPGHHLYAIRPAQGGKAIGMAWFELKQRHGKRKAFISDFRLEKAQRGKGLGRQALAALDVAARALYEKSGFRYSSMHMTKDLY